MYRVITCLLLTSALCLAACGSDDIELPIAPADTIPVLDKNGSLLANCEIVRLALEQFATDNGGHYPETTSSPGSNGQNLIDYLPHGRLLVNPYAGTRSEPTDAGKAPGQTGYVSVHDDAGHPTGYVVEGIGAQIGDLVFVFRKKPLDHPELTKDDSVLTNCEIVRLALEQFAADNGGNYPETKWTTGSNGEYLIDYLPGGQNLVNPYHGGRSEPTDYGRGPGETGYISAHNGGVPATGYIIEGTGAAPPVLIYRYYRRPLGQR